MDDPKLYLFTVESTTISKKQFRNKMEQKKKPPKNHKTKLQTPIPHAVKKCFHY